MDKRKKTWSIYNAFTSNEFMELNRTVERDKNKMQNLGKRRMT